MTETVFAAGDPAQYCAFGDGGEFAPSTLVLASGGLYVLAGDIDLLTFDAGVTTLLSQSDFFAHEIALGRDGQLFAATSDTNQDGWQIVKIIGSGFVSYVGDTSAGTCLASAETDGGATLYGVTSLIGDDAGYLYIGETADLTHSCSYIRRVDPTGHVLPLAGDGANSLNDGSGPEAEFFGPSGLALDAQGNLYVADSDNDLIRKVAPSGFTSTLAGTQDPGFQDGPGGPDGTATFNDPGPLTVDAAGNIYVADIGNLAIRRVAPDGTTTTLAGNGQSGSTDGTLGRDGTTTFRSVSGIAVDAAGKTIYVADQGSCAIRVIHLDN